MNNGQISAIGPADLVGISDENLLQLRAGVAAELKRRGLAADVGQAAEALAIKYFNGTAGRPNLQAAPTGTQCVDALSRKGDRYSIKGIMRSRKTGTIYPDRNDPDKQLFEYLLIVKVDDDWRLETIYELDWKSFCRLRKWDSHMKAWYIGIAAKTLSEATVHRP